MLHSRRGGNPLHTIITHPTHNRIRAHAPMMTSPVAVACGAAGARLPPPGRHILLSVCPLLLLPPLPCPAVRPVSWDDVCIRSKASRKDMEWNGMLSSCVMPRSSCATPFFRRKERSAPHPRPARRTTQERPRPCRGTMSLLLSWAPWHVLVPWTGRTGFDHRSRPSSPSFVLAALRQTRASSGPESGLPMRPSPLAAHETGLFVGGSARSGKVKQSGGSVRPR